MRGEKAQGEIYVSVPAWSLQNPLLIRILAGFLTLHPSPHEPGERNPHLTPSPSLVKGAEREAKARFMRSMREIRSAQSLPIEGSG
jgi:hypothetical protein